MNVKKRYEKMRNGFTLIEMLAVVFIVGFFSSLVLVGLRRNFAASAINDQVLIFFDYLEKAQSLALSGSIIESLTPRSYGLIAADTVGFQNNPDLHECASGCLFADTAAGLFYLAKIQWSDDLRLDRGQIDEWRVDFELPRAKTFIALDDEMTKMATFRLLNEKNGLTRCIEINSVSGRFDLVNCP